jgi:phosphopentomutase
LAFDLMKKFYVIIIFSGLLSSCIIQAPKYSTVEKAFTLSLGMSMDSVSRVLGIPAYDLKTVSDSETVLIYKYRTTERKTIPFLMNQTNGVSTKGKWGDLFVTYGANKRVKHISSCSGCQETKITEKKIDLTAIITFVSTLALPAVLLYLGIKL